MEILAAPATHPTLRLTHPTLQLTRHTLQATHRTLQLTHPTLQLTRHTLPATHQTPTSHPQVVPVRTRISPITFRCTITSHSSRLTTVLQNQAHHSRVLAT
jgi:hypothetical protein